MPRFSSFHCDSNSYSQRPRNNARLNVREVPGSRSEPRKWVPGSRSEPKKWVPGKLGQTGFGHSIEERHFESLIDD